MKTYLIIDTKLVAYYLFHRHQDIFGSMNLIADLASKNLPKNKFGNIIPIFVMDKGQSRRVKIFKDYKAHRKDLIKKQGEAYVKKQKQFEKNYQKMEKLYRIYGKTLNIQGLEADDLASIIASFSKVDKIVFGTSDSDWVKFMIDDRFSMLHINRQKLIPFSSLAVEFDVPNPTYKLFKDVFCGVKKENVSGLKRLGEKTFKKLVNKAGLELDNLKEEVNELLSKGKIFLPDDVNNLDELVDRNLTLFTPMSVDDMLEEEKQEFKKQWQMPSSKNVNEILDFTAKNFDNIHLPSSLEKKFFNLA